MNESNAKLILTVATASSLLAVIVAIILGLRGEQFTATAFLVVGVLDGIMAFVLYRRYTGMRRSRWKDELSESQNELDRLLSEDRRPTNDDRPSTDERPVTDN